MSNDRAKADTRRSKFLSLALRHDPASIGLSLDAAGWAGIDAVLSGAERAGVAIDRDDLLRVVAESDKKRFTISPDGERIRAAQGHSVEVALGLAPSVPPDVLFHGTVERFLAVIFEQGLRPMSRQQVHLSPDRETAERVGRRRGTPVILAVDSAAMSEAGHRFYVAENGVWLTDIVPPRYLQLID